LYSAAKLAGCRGDGIDRGLTLGGGEGRFAIEPTDRVAKVWLDRIGCSGHGRIDWFGTRLRTHAEAIGAVCGGARPSDRHVDLGDLPPRAGSAYVTGVLTRIIVI
jgi:hypothetical protein